MGKYAANNPRFIPEPLAVAHTCRAWALLESGFDADSVMPNEIGMTPLQAARYHLTQALDCLDSREARLQQGLNPTTSRRRRKPTLAEIAVAEDRPDAQPVTAPIA